MLKISYIYLYIYLFFCNYNNIENWFKTTSGNNVICQREIDITKPFVDPIVILFAFFAKVQSYQEMFRVLNLKKQVSDAVRVDLSSFLCKD